MGQPPKPQMDFRGGAPTSPGRDGHSLLAATTTKSVPLLLSHNPKRRVYRRSRVLARLRRLRFRLPSQQFASGAWHLVTLDPDGSPQVTCGWVAVEGDELVTAHLDPEQRKLAKRVAIPASPCPSRGPRSSRPAFASALSSTARRRSRRAAHRPPPGARVRLPRAGGQVPPIDDPPPGVRLRIAVERVGGIGPSAG